MLPSLILMTAAARLTAGGGTLSESYESDESDEMGGAPLIYALVLSQQCNTLAPFHCKAPQPHGVSHGASSHNSHSSHSAPASAAMHTADAITNLDDRSSTLDRRGRHVV